ncbi:dihydroneopterin aldolase [Candidatus Vallotiella sp. (ex Adelges kitamiensis)]|uniref:dihydroneopterin aldolase n=1 Tax=Candidatus Vallotiella sp. (ex Adelges kitamiensis) TaxID=2864217 RepID=UPI001CE298C1|nr:dihydroneopterin aldolase [Candidatus Vallotia sp. (ex Adelges kitamiensis)]
MLSALFHPRLINCRRLFLRNYEIYINIGAHDFEKHAEQRVIVNIDLFIPLSESTPCADKLVEVVDYDFMRSTIEQRISRGHVNLQETLCDDVAAAMLLHESVKAVRVSTEKLDVYPDCKSVGIEIIRIKEA